MKILITGVAGQDGQILSGQLNNKGHQIYGICRKAQIEKLKKSQADLSLLAGDLSDSAFVEEILNKIQPDIIYNLAGFSSVRQSWIFPEVATRINAELPAQLLSWCVKNGQGTRLVQASSSEIFGKTDGTPRNELSNLHPTTPYGLTKSLAHQLISQYRDIYGGHFSSAILFNHESIYRDEHFVLRHITASVARISLGLQDFLEIGDLDAQRDWGWAPDYTLGLEMIANLDKAGDFVLSTGELHSVREIIQICFRHIRVEDFEKYLVVNPELLRKKDHFDLVGDSKKAKENLGWKNTRDFSSIIVTILDHDLEKYRGELNK
jgi:GDPmannose 4,6-dehydratase